MDISKIQELWKNNKERYLKAEKGSSGNEGFVKEVLIQFFGLIENNDGENKLGSFEYKLKIELS